MVRRRQKDTLIGRAGVGFFLFLLSGNACAQDVAGYVAAIDGEPKLAKLLRGNATARQLRLGEDILVGDTIVSQPAARVRVEVMGKAVDPCLDQSNVPECRYTFREPTGAHMYTELEHVWSMLSWVQSTDASIVTRGGGVPRVFVGGQVLQKIGSGYRALWFAWRGGAPPFEIVLEQKGRELAQAETTATEIVLPAAQLKQGEYQIRVTNANKESLSWTFSVGEIPVIPETLKRATINKDHRILLTSAWLATRGDGEYSFEAAQRLGEIAARIPAAEMLRVAISRGDKL